MDETIKEIENIVLKSGLMDMDKDDLTRMRFLSILQTYGFIDEDMSEKIIFYFVQRRMKNER